MNVRNRLAGLALALPIAGAALFAPAPAQAEIINCIEITSLPTVITTQGVYCLKGHLSNALAMGAAITVNTNNVTIDCNEFKIGNLAAGAGNAASGVRAQSRLNVTVRNCGIRGFRTGVDLTTGQYRVENNRLDNNTHIGIRVTGSGSVARGNEVIDTGQSAASEVTNAYGISAEGDVDIVDNIVSGVAPSASGVLSRNAYGIYGSNMNAAFIKGNRVSRLAPNGLLGNRFGIVIASGSNNSVRSNTLVMGSGLIAGDQAIQCGGALLGLLGGVAVDNVVLQAGLIGTVGSLLNCTNILGGNYISII